jgi:hypothetical protein
MMMYGLFVSGARTVPPPSCRKTLGTKTKRITSITIHRIADGKLVEKWAEKEGVYPIMASTLPTAKCWFFAALTI